MTVLALAVTGRGLVDPMEPVIRADDDGLLRGRAATLLPTVARETVASAL